MTTPNLRAKYAQSVQRRFSRWLHNNRIKPYRIYAPIVRQVFELDSVNRDNSESNSFIASQIAMGRVSLLEDGGCNRRDEAALAIVALCTKRRNFLEL